MDETLQESATAPQWQPLSARDRRVVGVLVEKAKTTPSAYPMTLNAIRTGCNQKSNRYPVMDLQDEDVRDALENLRSLDAIVEVHGDGRVAKYRHLLYDWLGVNKVELAVMIELLLRGAQTVGELRGRSARMEPIADLSALKPVLGSLKEKGLVVYLTPEGRGCVVTHTLYQPQELERLRQKYGGAHAAAVEDPPAAAVHPSPPRSSDPGRPMTATVDVDALRSEVQQLQFETQELREELARLTDALRMDLDNVKSQLGI